MIRCREIAMTDLEDVTDLLARGFADRSRDYWMDELRCMSVRETREAFPRFGYTIVIGLRSPQPARSSCTSPCRAEALPRLWSNSS
jgi:hypothetical protein